MGLWAMFGHNLGFADEIRPRWRILLECDVLQTRVVWTVIRLPTLIAYSFGGWRET